MASGKSAVVASKKAAKSRAMHEAVLAMTEQIFGSPATIEQENDPELPISYYVVLARAGGEVDQIVELNRRWHAALDQVAGNRADLYRLSLEVQ